MARLNTAIFAAIALAGATVEFAVGAPAVARLAPLPINVASGISIQFVSARRGFIWQRQTILRTDDGGTSWTALSVKLPGYQPIEQAHFFATGTGWIISGDSVFVTSSFGDSWKELPDTPLRYPTGTLRAAFFDPSGRLGWLCGGEYALDRTIEGRNLNVWRYAVDGRADGIYVAHPAAFSTDDGGEHWRRQTLPSGLGYFVDHVQFVGSNDGVMTVQGSVLVTSDRGSRWEAVISDPSRIPERRAVDLFALNASNSWVSFADGALLSVSIKSGKVRVLEKPQTRDSDEQLSAGRVIGDMYFSTAREGFGLDPRQRRLYRTQNGGTSWQPFLAGLDVVAYSGLDGSLLWTAGRTGLIRVERIGNQMF